MEPDAVEPAVSDAESDDVPLPSFSVPRRIEELTAKVNSEKGKTRVLRNSHTEAIGSLKAKHTEAMGDLKAKYGGALVDLKAKHTGMIVDLKAKHSEALKEQKG